MSFLQHRKKLFETIENNSLVISYAGMPIHTNEDDYYNFEVNSQFYYLTGLEREGMILLMAKMNGIYYEYLFIEESDPMIERWTGKMPTKETAGAVSKAANILYLNEFDSVLDRYLTRSHVERIYFDLYRNAVSDSPDYNLSKANEFHDKYPGIVIRDLRTAMIPLREKKDSDEIACIRKAAAVTKAGLETVMKTLKPGMPEYQLQAAFEYSCKCSGTKKFSFNTIAGSGINGCMMHYDTNDGICREGQLLLLDLGAKYQNYCSDVTRTYPISGTYSPRQKEIYDLVLKANRAVADTAKPGMTLRELNDLTKIILAEGLIAMGLIKTESEVGRYYMHGVSHSIGIDCHDCAFPEDKLEPGWVISDEPGLYIDEEETGIRIEDDLLITENGCEVLTGDIIRTTEEIEAFMKQAKEQA